MKSSIIFSCLIGLFFCSCTHKSFKNTYPSASLSESANSDIDWEKLQNDIKYKNLGNKLPLKSPTFPVKNYFSPGNSTYRNQVQICESQFNQHSVGVKKGDYNRAFFQEVSDSIDRLTFFTILVKTNKKVFNSRINLVSRNHPVTLAQGVVNIEKNRKISWVAVRENETNHDMAIINMKYFDLNKGRLVIVLPMKDGSLRFMQVDIKQESIDNLSEIIQNERESWCTEIEKLIKLGNE